MKPKIVFIDDEPITIDWVEEAFYLDEIDVEIEILPGVSDFGEKLEEWKSNTPALFVLDLMMVGGDEPLVSGYKCFEILRNTEATKNVPIVFLTGYSRRLEEKFQKNTPNDVFIFNKPVDIEKFIGLVRSILVATGSIVPSNKKQKNTLFDSAELKPGLFGVKVDLKKLSRGLRASLWKRQKNR